MQPRIVLASSSAYRRAILAKLGLAFHCATPDIDETATMDEPVISLVTRLAQQKAAALVPDFPSSTIIGSDQLGFLDGQCLGKPLTYDRAFTQLRAASGKCVTFYTGLAVYHGPTASWHQCVDTYQVYFKSLTDREILGYIDKEQPLQCAGSFKCEGLGISLFDKMVGDDPNTLIGLPLIALTRILCQLGINPLLANDGYA